jgi:hypothetical protein
VNNRKEHTRKTSAKQGSDAVTLKLMKIGATTPYDPVTLCYTSLSL